MIYSGGSSPDTEHTPAILKRSKKTEITISSGRRRQSLSELPGSCVPMETPMKIFAAAFCALNIAIFFPSALYPQRATERPKFRVEIHPTGEKGPTYTVTNLSSKAVWALVLEISSSSQPARESKKVWDSILESHPPVEPGASISQPLAEFGRSTLPDQ